MSEEKSLILVVEDDRTTAKQIEGLLGDCYDVKVVRSGKDALSYVGERLPSLILLDICMPEMDGFEVCRRLKNNIKTHDIPVIFLTNSTAPEAEVQGLKLGAVDFVTKPLKQDVVHVRIKTHLELMRSREKLKNIAKTLSRYLSPEIHKHIFEGKTEDEMKPKRKKLTIFFSDIVGFTDMSNRKEHEDLVQVIEDYLDRMISIAHRYSGTVDKFLGDSMLIFFGDPNSEGEENDALSCIKMAMDMQSATKVLMQEWKKKGIAIKLDVRMGIATGRCAVGNFGNEIKTEYTIVGSPVNLASRLVGLADPGTILMSEETELLVASNVHVKDRGSIQVKGFPHPAKVCEVIGFHGCL